MTRVLSPVLAVAVFIGAGYFTRHYYRQWIETTIKEASAANLKESGKWKVVETNFSNVKFDQPILATPKFELPKSQPSQPSAPRDNKLTPRH